MHVTTWLITGCSSGLGRALADAVLARGDNAVVAVRDASKVTDLADGHPGTALAVALDVTGPTQVTAAVEQVVDRFGGIDVLVDNAGYGYRPAVEEGDNADVQQLRHAPLSARCATGAASTTSCCAGWRPRLTLKKCG